MISLMDVSILESYISGLKIDIDILTGSLARVSSN